MTQTPIHSLPYIAASQAQKHVTHNEALRLLDILTQLGVQDHQQSVPPLAPAIGERHIVGSGGSGVWSGQDTKIAINEDTGWAFVAPVSGMLAFDLAGSQLIFFDGEGWQGVPANLVDANFENLSGIGVNAISDAANRLAVASTATLLNHDGAGHQVKINKAGSGDTGSLLYQTNWSGRAEMGLAGDDDWGIKVSADGSTWLTALRIDRATGDVIAHAGIRAGQVDAATRPLASAIGAGAMIYDTDLSKPIWSDGSDWRDAAGTIV